MPKWLVGWLKWRAAPGRPISDELWQRTLACYPFLRALPEPDRIRLRALSSAFLARKEFHGARGFEITDEVAVAVAAQACLPLLHLAAGLEALNWYDDFIGIVIHPGGMVARRETIDDSGVVHQYREVISG